MNENQYDMRRFNYGQQPMYFAQQQQVYFKCRPVSSIEEARAAQIDLDGTPTIFTDFGNKKIYTKFVSQNGTVSLKVYELVEDANAGVPSYVTREEFNKVIAQINDAFSKVAAPKQNSAQSSQTFNI